MCHSFLEDVPAGCESTDLAFQHSKKILSYQNVTRYPINMYKYVWENIKHWNIHMNGISCTFSDESLIVFIMCPLHLSPFCIPDSVFRSSALGWGWGSVFSSYLTYTVPSVQSSVQPQTKVSKPMQLERWLRMARAALAEAWVHSPHLYQAAHSRLSISADSCTGVHTSTHLYV